MDNSYNKGSCGFALKKFYIPCIIYIQAEFVTDYSPGYCPGLCHVRPPAYILFKNFYNNELTIENL